MLGVPGLFPFLLGLLEKLLGFVVVLFQVRMILLELLFGRVSLGDQEYDQILPKLNVVKLQPLGLIEIPFVIGIGLGEDPFRVGAMGLDGHDRQTNRQHGRQDADLLSHRILLFMLMMNLELSHILSLLNPPEPGPRPAARLFPNAAPWWRTAPREGHASPSRWSCRILC